MLKFPPGTGLVDVVLEVGPYSLTYYRVEGDSAAGKYSLRYKYKKVTEYLWKDGVFRNVAGTSTDIWGGWFDSMEDVLITLEAAFPGVGEIVG